MSDPDPIRIRFLYGSADQYQIKIIWIPNTDLYEQYDLKDSAMISK